jgi:hypothetical protein
MKGPAEELHSKYGEDQEEQTAAAACEMISRVQPSHGWFKEESATADFPIPRFGCGF